MGLTTNQDAVLTAIIAHTRERGATPVFRQIRARCGLADSSITRALNRLQLEGFVEQDGRHASYAPRKSSTGRVVAVRLVVTRSFDT